MREAFSCPKCHTHHVATSPCKATEPLVPAHGSVFEVVDSSNEEQYYTIGIWPTLAGALAALDACGDTPPGEDLDEDCRSVEVRERRLGVMDWSGLGSIVAKISWVKSAEDDTFNEWKRFNPANAEVCGGSEPSASPTGSHS